MTTVEELIAMFAHAGQFDHEVEVPAGKYGLTRPLRVPSSGLVYGRGSRVTEFFPATVGESPVFTPLLLAIPPLKDTAPILADGLHCDAVGRMSLKDYWKPSQPNTPFAIELEFTLPALSEGVQHTLAWAKGALDDIDFVTPFGLSVTGSKITLDLGVGDARLEFFGEMVPAVRTKIVVQHTGTRRHCWVVRGTTRTLLADVPASGPLVWPRYCDLTIGASTERFGEGVGGIAPAPGLIVHRVSVASLCLYSPESPPAASTLVQDNQLGVWTAFANPDGCLFDGTVAGHPAVMLWRANTEDEGVWGGIRVEGLKLSGLGRSPAGLWVAGAHESGFADLVASGHRYGVAMAAQCYGTKLDTVHATGNEVGVLLANNCSILTVLNLHAEANQFGLLAADSDGMNVVGGWIDNNPEANLIVKGDNATATVVGCAIACEGTVTKHNILVANSPGVVFTGSSIGPLVTPIPAAEFRRSSGGLFAGCRFGIHATSPAAVVTTDHDLYRPVEILTPSLAWAGGRDVATPFALVENRVTETE